MNAIKELLIKKHHADFHFASKFGFDFVNSFSPRFAVKSSKKINFLSINFHFQNLFSRNFLPLATAIFFNSRNLDFQPLRAIFL